VALAVQQFQIRRLHQRVDVRYFKQTFLTLHPNVLTTLWAYRIGCCLHRQPPPTGCFQYCLGLEPVDAILTPVLGKTPEL
jgi:hypothetical protein